MKSISRAGKAKRAHLGPFQVGTARRTRLCPPYSPRNDLNFEIALLEAPATARPGSPGMTIADITLAVFTFCNSLRFLAYIPQIAKVIRDQSGAEAISFGTWGLVLASHASATAYALENQGDLTMASMFLGNALGCGAILLIAAWK